MSLNQAEQIERMAEALQAGLKLFALFMRDANHGGSAYQGETLMAMNETPGLMQRALRDAGFSVEGI